MRTLLSALLALAFALTGCGPAPIKLINSPVVPAATGEITTAEGDNGNLQLEIDVKFLAPPEKVAAGASVYVVWLEQVGAPPQNVGALRVGEDRRGSLHTVTAFHRFNLMITAEANSTTAVPTGPRVLSAVVDR